MLLMVNATKFETFSLYLFGSICCISLCKRMSTQNAHGRTRNSVGTLSTSGWCTWKGRGCYPPSSNIMRNVLQPSPSYITATVEHSDALVPQNSITVANRYLSNFDCVITVWIPFVCWQAHMSAPITYSYLHSGMLYSKCIILIGKYAGNIRRCVGVWCKIALAYLFLYIISGCRMKINNFPFAYSPHHDIRMRVNIRYFIIGQISYFDTIIRQNWHTIFI